MSDSGNALEKARREYAETKTVALSAQLQGISVAKFEVDALPEKRQVFWGDFVRSTPQHYTAVA